MAGAQTIPSEVVFDHETNAHRSVATQPARISSQARNRGYSLRRSLFTQNVQKQNANHGNVMELGPSSSSSRNVASPSKTEKGPAVITIEEADEDKNGAHLRAQAVGNKIPSHSPSRPSWLCYVPSAKLRNTLTTLSALHDHLLGPAEVPRTADGRHVHVNISKEYPLTDERTSKPHITNKIRSCKYTLLNFVPRQLVAQFGKLANFYFLVISILQMIPGLSTTGSYTTIIPLLIFVSLSMAKEGYEDVRRNRLDKEENERVAFVLNQTAIQIQDKASADLNPFQSSSAVWSRTKWQDLRVGDVVLLDRDAPIPADLVLLKASNPEGTAYIETKSLDGETNLKSKKPLEPVLSRCNTEADIARLEADFVVEDPNLDLYKFEGRASVAGQTLPLTSSEVIYRGSVIRNTLYAVGLIVYSGEECKIRMNANKDPRIKAPTLQAKVNRVIIIVACFVLFIAIVESIGYTIWKRTTEDGSWYLDNADVPFGHILTSFVIMFNTMLPLSLYVSLEIVKVAQIFMMNDVDMYDPDSDIPMEPKTSTLNEELGQVSYIFSDKTGTLTNNSMRFRKMSIAGTAWLHDHDLQEDIQGRVATRLRHKKRSRSMKGKHKQESHKHRRGISSTPLVQPKGLGTGEAASPGKEYAHTGKTEDLLDYIQRRPQSLFARKVRFFILAMALCHTCIPEKDDEGNIDFQAASPDELALVTAAQDMGFIVTDRQANSIVIKTYPQGDEDDPVFETYQVMEVIEFSSARKRMSILIKFPDGRICLFTKGADTTIRKLLKEAEVAATYIEQIHQRVEARKSMEAYAAKQRKSNNFGRLSMSDPHRTSSLGRKRSVRESIDMWLTDKESHSNMPRYDGMHYTPRHSETMTQALYANRVSVDNPRSSFQTNDLDDFVDESIVINDSIVLQRCFNHINDFATEGLRTLVYGHRFISESDYQTWKKLHHAASTSLTDRQAKIEKAAESIEKQLELTGATAIEDKLQDGVPDAIERFRRAGIKMWMLTGDKRETAINIGSSCGLIKDYSSVMVLDHESSDLHERITNFVEELQGQTPAHTVLVVDGQTLTVIDENVVLHGLFTDLAIATDSVICCRASPSQKAALVKTIRTKVKGSVTLAIGDGANDIAMIREAHLGIGIAGKEGMQAARTSDYSIAQFRFLVKLLLVHGRWNYVRVCKYTLGTFWKEMCFYLVQAAYQRWTGYTGTSLYEPWSLSMFNTLFTSLPVIFMGVFEKDLSAATLLAVPELYALGQQNRGFNIPLYACWAFSGAVEAMLVYFIMYSIYGSALFTRDNQLFAMGALAFTACVTIISLKIQFFELHNKSIMAAIAIFLSIGGWWLWNLILSEVYNPGNTVYHVHDGLVHSFGRNILWWLTLILIVLVFSVFELLTKAVKTIFFPNDVEIFQVYERDLEIKKRFEESASGLLQQGWDRGNKRSSLEIAREEANNAKREAEIQEILDRPRTMDLSANTRSIGLRKRPSWQSVDVETIMTGHEADLQPGKKSIDTGNSFAKGFGVVRKESMS